MLHTAARRRHRSFCGGAFGRLRYGARPMGKGGRREAGVGSAVASALLAVAALLALREGGGLVLPSTSRGGGGDLVGCRAFLQLRVGVIAAAGLLSGFIRAALRRVIQGALRVGD